MVMLVGLFVFVISHIHVATAAVTTESIRVGSWNVYYKALDDEFGRQAIIKTIDDANALNQFDLFGVVEATGDTNQGTFPGWTNESTALGSHGLMSYVSGHSQYETIVLYYRSIRWKVAYQLQGQFEPGRPFLLVNLVGNAAAADGEQAQPPLSPNSLDDVWVLVVHLNHYFITFPNQIDPTVPGAVLALALANASEATGKNISQSRVLIFGDFNEYQWEDFELPYRPDAVRRMKPLWDGFFHGRMADTTAPHSVSCCTKWAQADRGSTNYTEWRFEYDHIFASDDFVTVANSDVFLPYSYPGVAQPCNNTACTGEDPPLNVTATHQGSWHRAVHATLMIKP
eukprot:m.97374 g.97374  ORF g.97374 m.97374 type:complete len:342 (-) comp26974_c1_seq2:47-1072(-)